MAFINCPKCGRLVPDTYTNCPMCKAPLNAPKQSDTQQSIYVNVPEKSNSNGLGHRICAYTWLDYMATGSNLQFCRTV